MKSQALNSTRLASYSPPTGKFLDDGTRDCRHGLIGCKAGANRLILLSCYDRASHRNIGGFTSSVVDIKVTASAAAIASGAKGRGVLARNATRLGPLPARMGEEPSVVSFVVSQISLLKHQGKLCARSGSRWGGRCYGLYIILTIN